MHGFVVVVDKLLCGIEKKKNCLFQHDYLIKDINLLAVQLNLFLQIDIVHCKSEILLFFGSLRI